MENRDAVSYSNRVGCTSPSASAWSAASPPAGRPPPYPCSPPCSAASQRDVVSATVEIAACALLRAVGCARVEETGAGSSLYARALIAAANRSPSGPRPALRRISSLWTNTIALLVLNLTFRVNLEHARTIPRSIQVDIVCLPSHRFGTTARYESIRNCVIYPFSLVRPALLHAGLPGVVVERRDARGVTLRS
jgi:hypothetical protein